MGEKNIDMKKEMLLNLIWEWDNGSISPFDLVKKLKEIIEKEEKEEDER